MNILVFSWRDPKHPLAGGAEQVMHEHMKGWVKDGHKVTLFSSRVDNLKESEVLDGIVVVRKGYQYLGVQLKGFVYYLKNTDNFDVVVDQFHGVPFFTPLYVRKPILAVIQEPAKKVWFLNPLPFPLNYIVGGLGYLFEPIFFLFYKKTMFMTGSNSAKVDVSKLGIPSKNITVVPHGVIIKRPANVYKKETQKTLVYLGILSKDKGIEDALKCFSILVKQGNYQLWVVGKAETEDYRNKVLNMASNLNISSKIKFWGFVSSEKKFELLSKAHVLLNPSVHEGWGLVNIEANAMGIPVIAYIVPGCLDSVVDGKTGILVEKGDVENLAKSVTKIVNDERKYKELSENSLSWSKEFDWEKSRKKSIKLLKTVLDE